MDCGAVGLLTLDTLDVENVSASVDLDNLAGLLALVVTSCDLHLFRKSLILRNKANEIWWAYHDFVIFAHWHAADSVLLAQLLAQWGAHDLPSDV